MSAPDISSSPSFKTSQTWFAAALALLLLLLLFNINPVRRQVYAFFPALRAGLNLSLGEAARTGDMRRVAVLLKRGADVNAEIDSTTPLLNAVENNHFQVAHFLLQQGANPNSKNSSGSTPFTVCMERPHRSFVVVSSLANLTLGKKVRNHIDLAMAMLKHGANVHARADNGDPIFFEAAYSHDRRLMEEMLRRGADINARMSTYTGATVLFLTVDGPSSKINKNTLEWVRYLLARGADPNIRCTNSTDKSSFITSISRYYGDPEGLKPVEREIIVELIRAKANVNEVWWEGETPLMLAVQRRDAFIVSQLLKAGAKVNARNNDGDTALKIARREKQQHIVQLLEQAGAKD
jgi:ankyrin repeat protein